MNSDSHYLQAFLALILVMAMIGMLAIVLRWWQRRGMFLMMGQTGERKMQLLEQLPLGNRGRLVLLQCLHETLLLHVTPGGIHHLATYSGDEASPDDHTKRPDPAPKTLLFPHPSPPSS